MTAPTAASGAALRARYVGLGLLVLAAFTAIVFGLDAEGDATFRLSNPRDDVQVGPLVLPALPFIEVAAALIAFFGVRLLRQSHQSAARIRTNLWLGLAVLLFVMAFLTWATAGKTLSLMGLLQSAVVRAVPIAFGGLAGVLSERVAVINIAIEGMLLAGAFAGAVIGSLAGGTIGLVGATLTGGLMGLLLALLVVTYRVDQIIAGVVINIFVLGLTSYLTSQILNEYRHLNDAPIFRAIEIPFLSEIPLLGPVLFNQNLFVYAAMLLVGVSTYYLFYTRTGLRARAVGEHPRAADTLGIDVFRTRYINVTLAGMVAGFGGAWFTLGAVGRFDENMTAGRGFIGLAAMIFGRWHPVGVLFAALVFGFADTLQQKLAILQTPIPSEFLAMAPYLATIIVVAGLIGRARPPAADGQPYTKD